MIRTAVAICPLLGLVLVSVVVVVLEHEQVAEEDEAVGQLGEAQEEGEGAQRRLFFVILVSSGLAVLGRKEGGRDLENPMRALVV
jgi:hypothetical protein